MPNDDPINRRTFVGEVASTTAAFTIVPSHVLGRRHVAPSDKLNVACIGVGGKGDNDSAAMGAHREHLRDLRRRQHNAA